MDDFAIAAPFATTANLVLDSIDSMLIASIKRKGILEYFNGVNLWQTEKYVHMSCRDYLYCVLERHG